MNKETVKLNYLRIAPRKVRLVAGLLRGLSLNDAEAHLVNLRNRAALMLVKLFKSAEANIKNNQKKNPDDFYVQSISVDEGPMLKRMMPRARGRGVAIHKKSSHITLVLAESNKKLSNKFKVTINRPKLSKKTEHDHTHAKTFKENPEPSKIQDKKPGFLQRIFRRKSI